MEYCYRVSYQGDYKMEIKLFCRSDQLFSKISMYFQNTHYISDQYLMYSMITNIKKIDCYGCKHDRPGQIDHMGPDGCLGQ